VTVIPDSIEPVEAWRSWTRIGGKLFSHNGTPWDPGQPMKAQCPRTQTAQVWTLRRYEGLNLAAAAEHTAATNQRIASMTYSTFSQSVWGPQYLSPPTVEPPPGYGYVLATNRHDAPNEHCTCGIYAASEIGECPPGIVVGKVKLWGKVIPGERGFRAEYAYPSELYVAADLLDDEGLLAYGVPLFERDAEEHATVVPLLGDESSRRASWHWAPTVAIAMNLAACAFNILVAFKVIPLA
jgi:hypothetical protein